MTAAPAPARATINKWNVMFSYKRKKKNYKLRIPTEPILCKYHSAHTNSHIVKVLKYIDFFNSLLLFIIFFTAPLKIGKSCLTFIDSKAISAKQSIF